MTFQTEIFEKSKFKKVNLHNVHQELALTIDPFLDQYEQKKNIGLLRKSLLSHCQGFVLETAVGTSRNLNYYPKGTKIIGIDWSSNMLDEAVKKIVPNGIEVDYKLEDTEHLTFIDDVFDTVVDTFGLEAYAYPEKALNEMKRVCKKGGKILLLTCGLSDNQYLNRIINVKASKTIKQNGYVPNREWEPLIRSMGFTVEKFERKLNGTIYFYVLTNNK